MITPSVLDENIANNSVQVYSQQPSLTNSVTYNQINNIMTPNGEIHTPATQQNIAELPTENMNGNEEREESKDMYDKPNNNNEE